MQDAGKGGGTRTSAARRGPIAAQLLLGAVIAGLTLGGRSRGATGEPDSRASTGETASTGRETAGRGADRPTEIPPRGWLEVLRRVWDEIGRDNMSIIAAGCAFYALLALFPAITALVAIYGLVADPVTIEQQIGQLGGVVPKEAVDLLTMQAKAVAAQGQSRLSWGATLALLIALYGATSGVKTLFEALNVAYEERETRGFLRLNIVAFAFTVVAVVAVAIMISVIVGLPVLLAYLPLGLLGEWLVRIGSWVLLLGLVLLGLALLYRFGPSRAPARWRWVTPGSMAAAFLWLAASAAFSVYVAQFAAYNQTYGTLGGVVILLMWLYISVFVVLLGAELNAELELQTKLDTTTGPPLPMGRRRAYAADHTAEQRRG
jgi:membrane protein